MHINEFENKIQDEIREGLHIKRNLHTSDVAGVHMGTTYINVSLPQYKIYRSFNPNYKAREKGRPFRTIPEAMRDIRQKIHTKSYWKTQ